MKLPALGQAKRPVGKRERSLSLRQTRKRTIGSSKKQGESIRPGMNPKPTAPAAGRWFERTIPLHGKAGAGSSGNNGSGMAVIRIIAYGIEQAIPGCRQPQGWQQRTEHDSNPFHPPFDADKCKAFNVRAQNRVGRHPAIRDRRKVKSRCLSSGDSAATAPIPERAWFSRREFPTGRHSPFSNG